MTSPPPESLLLKEMAEQPGVLRALLASPPPALRVLRDALTSDPSRPVVLVARGSSDHAAIFGRYLLEVRHRRLVSLAAPSSVTLYGSGPVLSGAVVIAVSQSGAGEDVTRYVQEARRQGAVTAALVNVEGSPLARAAEWLLPLSAGDERAIPATKTVTAELCLFAQLSCLLGGGDLDGVADELEAALQRPVQPEWVKTLASVESISVVGRGFAYPIALEIALKLKEVARVRAEAFSSADFAHGPITLLSPTHALLAVDVGGKSADAAAGIAPPSGVPVLHLSARTFADEWKNVFAALAVGQKLGVELALALGRDPSAPPGLRKVTSTR